MIAGGVWGRRFPESRTLSPRSVGNGISSSRNYSRQAGPIEAQQGAARVAATEVRCGWEAARRRPGSPAGSGSSAIDLGAHCVCHLGELGDAKVKRFGHVLNRFQGR